MNRPLTEKEKQWLREGLKTLATGEYLGGGSWIDVDTRKVMALDEPIDPEPFLRQIADLRVTERCGCSDPTCETVRFQHYVPRKSIALVRAAAPDRRMLIIHINEETGMIAELEVA